MQVTFSGSTPNYAFIVEQLGAAETTDRIRQRQRAGDLAGMAEQVPDALLDKLRRERPDVRARRGDHEPMRDPRDQCGPLLRRDGLLSGSNVTHSMVRRCS